MRFVCPHLQVTTRHLAEFWMIEPEMAFADLNGDMDCAEAYLRHCFGHVLETCDDDLTFLQVTPPPALQIAQCRYCVYCIVFKDDSHMLVHSLVNILARTLGASCIDNWLAYTQ